jgi:type I restriction enzyme S subunit
MQRLPSGWRVKPLRAVSDYVVSNVDKTPVDGELPVRLCNYSDVYNNEFISLRLDFMACTATEDEIRKFGLLVDDVIITKDSESWDDIGIPALVVETAEDLVCGYHLALLRPHQAALSGRFLLRCLQAKVLRLQLELAANGVTRFGLPKSDIGAMRLPVPPLEGQLAIAEFLDRETARIDALIGAKQRLLDLLAEKRKAIIAAAVTRGLDPKVELRDSGVPWLGEIPAHWQTCHLRRALASMDYGTSQSVEPEGQVAVLRMGDLRDGELDFSRIGYVDAVTDDLLLRPGDLLFNRTNSLDQVGKVAKFRGHENDVSFASYLVRLRVNDKADSEFFNYLLNSPYVLARARAEALPAIGQANLNPSRYSYIVIAIPPHEEQRAIVEHIARETAKLDAVRAATERTIALLKERRSALIAAAVTGQIDVGAAA